MESVLPYLRFFFLAAAGFLYLALMLLFGAYFLLSLVVKIPLKIKGDGRLLYPPERRVFSLIDRLNPWTVYSATGPMDPHGEVGSSAAANLPSTSSAFGGGKGRYTRDTFGDVPMGVDVERLERAHGTNQILQDGVPVRDWREDVFGDVVDGQGRKVGIRVRS